MVLLVSNSKKNAQCITAIEQGVPGSVEAVATIPEAAAKLRTKEYAAVVVDQSLIENDIAASDALWKNAGAAIPVFANFAISNADRIVRDLRAALARREKEQLMAIRVAQAALRNELTGAVAGILLSSELALAQPAVPSSVADKLRSVHELALQIQSRLGSPA